MPSISIVMPVYNGAKYLEKSLKSVSNQTFSDVELICVDDGSTDNSLELLNELKDTYDFLVVITQENQGSGKARNTGIENAKGDYIAFLDADDVYLDENALDEMHSIASKSDANIVSANLQFVKKDYSIKENPHYGRGDYAKFDEYGQITPNDYGIPYAFYKNIFKREFLDANEIVFPDLLRGQDPVFLAKAFASTDVIYTCPLDLYGYNYSVGGGVNNKMNNYIKKKSYVRHFKDACDILSQANLTKISEQYKLHFSKYLNWKKNNADEELYQIYGDLFENPQEFFSPDDENYIVFNTAAQAYLLNYTDDEKRFEDVKGYLADIPVDILPKDIKKKYDLMVKSNSINDYHDKYYDYKISELEGRHDYLTNKIDELREENALMEEKVSALDGKVESVKSSAGFKMAKKVKRMLR